MEKAKFIDHFTSAVHFTVEFSQQFCSNTFSQNHRFKIIPSSKMLAFQLAPEEITILKLLTKSQDKLFSKEQVIELLFYKNRVPLWINITIYESAPDITIFELLCDGRFREDRALNYQADKYPPFHPLVSVPSQNLEKDIPEKFDINWKKEFDNSKKKKNFFTTLKEYFKI